MQSVSLAFGNGKRVTSDYKCWNISLNIKTSFSVLQTVAQWERDKLYDTIFLGDSGKALDGDQ